MTRMSFKSCDSPRFTIVRYLGENKMRLTPILTAAVLIIAVAASFGVAVINANSARKSTIAPASSSIDVMQLMKEAKNLPQEQFDAH